MNNADDEKQETTEEKISIEEMYKRLKEIERIFADDDDPKWNRLIDEDDFRME